MNAGVSVLTLLKGRHRHLARLIEGLTRSAVAPSELIVADMAGDWVRPPVTAFPIRVLSMPSAGLPLAAARNAAGTAAASDTLVFLDVDCIPRRDLVGGLAAHLSVQSSLACAEVRYLGAGETTAGWDEDHLWSLASIHPVRSFPAVGARVESNPGLFWSLAFGIRRRAFLELGGFDESFTGYGAEDTDFGFRAQAAGLPLVFLGGVGALHQHHGVVDPPLQHFADIVRNAGIFRRKWRVWPMLGWLEQFQARGLIDVSGERITIIRPPTPQEVDAARIDRAF